jgi:hypothetical protein
LAGREALKNVKASTLFIVGEKDNKEENRKEEDGSYPWGNISLKRLLE